VCVHALRESGPIDIVLLYVATLLLAVGVAGLVIHTRNVGRFGRLGWIGLVASVVGVAVVIISDLVGAVFFGGDDIPLRLFFVIPGGLVLLVGILLLGITILRARVLPLWVAVLFVVGTLAVIWVNDRTGRYSWRSRSG
jgi:hypothetical protein